MSFAYDASGSPLSLNYNGTQYVYATNIQGDVIAILDASGTAVVTYTYDAWGSPLSISGTMASTLGNDNPLRYRGYVYDQETELYYLQSRYYNPQTGRFLNADVVYDLDAGLEGYNLFLYCANDPVGRIDVSGTDSSKIDDGDILDDEFKCYGEGGGSWSGGSSSWSGFANAYNAIDAGYTYGVDLSQAANSSSFHGGIATNGYTQIQTTNNYNSRASSKRFTPDQQAVIALAKEYKNGISSKEAAILVDWAEEYGISNHGPMTHENRSGYWSTTLHINILKYHIVLND